MAPNFRRALGSGVRKASHAGSWYSDTPAILRGCLQKYLDEAPKSFNGNAAPVEHARVIIAPHAGYTYSGPTAGVAYKALALGPETKNVFVLGPSHHVYLTTATVSCCDELETPIGGLVVNKAINEELQQSGLFGEVSKRNEESEHSLEMQFPFIRFLIDKVFPDASPEQQPQVVPIMIGNTSFETERRIGEALAPYLKDPKNVFVVSSDFAHWGRRFSYTYYVPKQTADFGSGIELSSNSQVDSDTPIWASIQRVDTACTDAISTGHHELFSDALRKSNNTVCGRHPIGVMMAAIEVLKKELTLHDDLCRFKFTFYKQSSEVHDFNDSSVSYASAYAKVQCMNVLHFIEQIEDLQEELSEKGEEESRRSYDGLNGGGSGGERIFESTQSPTRSTRVPSTLARLDRSSSTLSPANHSLDGQQTADNSCLTEQERRERGTRYLRQLLQLDEPGTRRRPSNDSMTAMYG